MHKSIANWTEKTGLESYGEEEDIAVFRATILYTVWEKKSNQDPWFETQKNIKEICNKPLSTYNIYIQPSYISQQ